MGVRLTNWNSLWTWLWSSEFRDLLTPLGHPDHIRRHRAKVIAERVRMVAAAFAILTPAWIVVDVLIFPWEVWGPLAVLRLLSSGLFFLLAHDPEPKRSRASMRRSSLLLVGLLGIPPIFYLLSIPILQGIEGGLLVNVAIHAYSLLPLVVVAGLSLFPLAAIEVVVASSGVFAVVMAGTALGPGLDAEGVVKGVWLVGLVIGASGLSCMSQLNYMNTLVAQAIKDPLTGAFTRRSGTETLELQFQISCRADLPLTVAFVDADNFKRLNDTFGHETGDDALRGIADSLRACLRQSDQLVRWGGEEFLVIMPNSKADGVQQVLERLRATGLGTAPDGRPITVSIGVAERVADQCRDWDKLIDIADRRMYSAKMAGKNRCSAEDDRHSLVITRAG